jgi:hypothetical protein
VPAETEHSVRFRFPVTWSTLVDPAALAPRPDNARVVIPRAAPADSNVEWAMVIPRLAPAAPAPRPLPAVESGWDAAFAPPKYVLPKFEVSSDSASLAVKLVLSASVLLLLAPGWSNTGSPGARAIEMESSMSERAWIRESAGPAKRLALYRASTGAADYRLDFTWKGNPPGVGWVFRAQDAKNYFAVRIKPSTAPGVYSLERFAVIHGVEKSRVLRTLNLPSKDPSLRVATDVAGPLFRLYVNQALVSQWTDSRLTAGGVGFLEEGRQTVALQSVRISFPTQ